MSLGDFVSVESDYVQYLHRLEFCQIVDNPPERSLMQFDHIGLITTEKKPGEVYVPAIKLWVTDRQTHPFRVEWLRFEPDSPMPQIVRETAHVAYRVTNLQAAAKGLKVLVEPFDAGIATVAFYQTDDGAIVELMEYGESSCV